MNRLKMVDFQEILFGHPIIDFREDSVEFVKIDYGLLQNLTYRDFIRCHLSGLSVNNQLNIPSGVRPKKDNADCYQE